MKITAIFFKYPIEKGKMKSNFADEITNRRVYHQPEKNTIPKREKEDSP